MFEVAIEALATIFQPGVLVYLISGIFIGLLVGILPGLGGVVGMSILLPFIYGMEPTAAMGLLIGMTAVTSSSDTFPSVLLGVPGSSSAQATVLDGYPMSQQGRAGEALGAAFVSSLIGGLFGAGIMFAGIFIARPLVLAFGSPHLFMLTLLGLSLVALLAKGAMRLGLFSGALGLLLGAVGGAPTTPVYRFSFDQMYLFDGIPLAILAIGLFAIPELVDLIREKRSVSSESMPRGGLLTGAKASIRNIPLVMRSAGIGSFVGIIPGLGGALGQWLAYGITANTSKDKKSYGKGNVRGVIAPESATNASEGGALIPTLMFGIPGSGTMAVMLGGLVLIGIQPGPSMATTNLSLTVSVVWMLVLANVVACSVLLLLARQVSKIAMVPAQIFAPFLLVILVVASYQSTRHWGDILALVILGALGWLMKRGGIPRPPLLIGFVLSVPAERYLWTSIERFGYSWIFDPYVIVIGFLTLLLVYVGLRTQGVADVGNLRENVKKVQS